MESSPPSRSWSIYTRSEIIRKYEILERIGSGTYSDVYRSRRLSDSTMVALKEVHDYQSGIREINALQELQNSPNVVVLHEYFWQENEDVVLVLEYLRTDLAAVIRDSKRSRVGGMSVGEIKRWIIQILHGVDACHRNLIVHRDLKPSNLLISDHGVLKLADFGQARTLSEPEFLSGQDTSLLQPSSVHKRNNLLEQDSNNQEETDELNPQVMVDEMDKETSVPADNTWNLLISDDGVFKLTDFGQARILSEPEFLSGQDTSLLQPSSVHKRNNFLEQDSNNQEETDELNPQVMVGEMDKETSVPADNTWNLLISDDGDLKLADIGQAKILSEPEFLSGQDTSLLQPSSVHKRNNFFEQDSNNQEETDELNPQVMVDEMDKETSVPAHNTSCLSTCCAPSDLENETIKGSYSDDLENETMKSSYSNGGTLTPCAGTRWFRAPELLYGSTNYGTEIDLWSMGCIFAELFTLEPLFPGASDIDQLSRIISVLGNLTPDSWPGCLDLPDFETISFTKVENPIGLEACLDKCGAEGITFVKRLICYDPASRATAMELLHDKFLYEHPLPVPIHELRIPLNAEDDSLGEWDLDSMSDMDEFGSVSVTPTRAGFSIQFP